MKFATASALIGSAAAKWLEWKLPEITISDVMGVNDRGFKVDVKYGPNEEWLFVTNRWAYIYFEIYGAEMPAQSVVEFRADIINVDDYIRNGGKAGEKAYIERAVCAAKYEPNNASSPSNSPDVYQSSQYSGYGVRSYAGTLPSLPEGILWGQTEGIEFETSPTFIYKDTEIWETDWGSDDQTKYQSGYFNDGWDQESRQGCYIEREAWDDDCADPDNGCDTGEMQIKNGDFNLALFAFAVYDSKYDVDDVLDDSPNPRTYGFGGPYEIYWWDVAEGATALTAAAGVAALLTFVF